MIELNEKEDVEEYRKRIRKIVERVEKTEDKDSKYTEQDIIERKEKLLQIIEKRTQKDKHRSEFIIATLTYWIRSIYKYEKERDHIPIDKLYTLVYEQLKKPNPYFPKFDLNRENPLEIADRRRILRNMENLIGAENIKSFKKRYNIKDSSWKNNYLSFNEKIVFTVIIFIMIFFGMLFGMFL